MNPRHTVPLLLSSLISLSLAQEPQTPAEILRQIAEYKQQQEEFDARWYAATDEARGRSRQAGRLTYVPETKPDARQLRKLKSALLSAERSATITRAGLVAARIKSPQTRATMLKEAEAEIAPVEAARKRANARGKARRAKLQQESAPFHEKLTELLTGVGRKPEGLGIAQVQIRPPARGTGTCLVWLDAEDEEVAILRLGLGPRTDRPQAAERAGLTMDYYPLPSGGVQVSLRVGGVPGWLRFRRPDWRGEEKCLKLTRKLVDLDRLAVIQKAEDGVPWDQLLGLLAEYRSKRSAPSKPPQEQRDPEQHRRYLNACRLRSEFSRPYDSQRVIACERMLAHRERSATTASLMLRLATTEDLAERKAKLAEADRERKRWQQACKEAEAPFLPEKRLLSESRVQLAAALEGLVEGVVRKPQGHANARVRIQVEDYGHATVHWRVDGWPVARGTLLLGTPLAIPDDAEKLAGKYPILAWSDEEIVLQVGGLGVRLTLWKVRWKDKKKLAGLVTQLIDLATIASWPVPASLGSRDIGQLRTISFH